MRCTIHDCEMEWIVYSDPIFAPGGFWFCQECWDDEEADFDPEHSDFEECEEDY